MSLQNNSFARYTEFLAVFNTNTDVYNELITGWGIIGGDFDSTRIEKLMSMIDAKFYNWEVYTLDEVMFKQSMTAIFKKHKDYYAEMLDTYETEINFLDGDKVTTEYENDGDSTPRAVYESTTYDLPRSSSTIDRPTTKSRNGGVDGKDSTHNEGTSTRKGGNVIDLKKKYLALIRNLYEEFAEKFRPCFIELFDGVFGTEEVDE